MPRLIYTALFYFISPFYFLRLAWKGIKNIDYLKRWPERLGFVKNLSSQKDVLWVHAVSVGEVNASLPLLRSLLDTYQNLDLLVTTTTPTGSEMLRRTMGNRIKHQYIPIDLPYCIKKFLNFWKPKALLILETEIWPNIIHECNKREIFIGIINARLSEKSKKNYLNIKSLINPSLDKIDLLVAQYNSDKKRFNELIKEKDIKLSGNLKYEIEIPSELANISNTIKDSWSIEGENRPLLIADSTHESEEEIILESFSELLRSMNNALLIICPRHPERFSQVYNLILKKNFKVARRSKKDQVDSNIEVLLGDTMGELNLLYSVSDIAFVGGSLIDHGGQNIIEPASLGKPICSGPNLRNFEDVAMELEKAEALKIIYTPKDITNYCLDLLNNEAEIQRLGEASLLVTKKNKGSLQKILSHLAPYLDNNFLKTT